MGFVYRYTHVKTGKWYIGSHNGNKKNYKGSGTYWARAKKLHGLENFDYEILYEGEDFREFEENILKALDAQNDLMSYNLKNEALGGTFSGNLNGMYGKKLSAEERFKCGSAFRGKKRPDHSEKMKGDNNPAFGKSEHSHGLVKHAKERAGKTLEEFYGEEEAALMREKMSLSQKGKKHKLKLVICPHCQKEGRGPNMTRYHFDNCKNVRKR